MQLVSTHVDNVLLASVLVESKVLALDSSDSCDYHECEVQAHGTSMHEFMDECCRTYDDIMAHAGMHIWLCKCYCRHPAGVVITHTQIM